MAQNHATPSPGLSTVTRAFSGVNDTTFGHRDGIALTTLNPGSSSARSSGASGSAPLATAAALALSLNPRCDTNTSTFVGRSSCLPTMLSTQIRSAFRLRPTASTEMSTG